MSKRNTPEADLSAALAEWLAYTHPHDNPKGLFSFMVPNEGFFPKKKQQRLGMWARLIRTGLRPGTADWCFVWWTPCENCGGEVGVETGSLTVSGDPVMAGCGACGEFGGWLSVGFIELKAGTNKQRESQETFQQQAEAFGLLYAVCRSLEECQETLREWGAV